MIIKGIQKTSMVDFPGNICSTLFTPGCNLRCPFCHNAGLVLGDGVVSQIEEDDLLAFLAERKGRIDGVCITGGEPLLQNGVLPFIEKIKSIGLKVKLDTNGFFPDKLKELLDAGVLDYVAMDVKNSAEEYPRTVGVDALDLAPLYRSLALLKEGRTDYELRTTVSKTFHTEASLRGAGELVRGAKLWALQAFKNSGNLISNDVVGFDENELQNLCNLLEGYAERLILRGI